MEQKYTKKDFDVLLNKIVALEELLKEYEQTTIEQSNLLIQKNKDLENSQTLMLQSAKMSAVGQLAGGVAHEINNPMGVILGFAQIMAKTIKEQDPYFLPVTSIEREAHRCKKLVADLLTFSRTGKTTMEKTNINAVIEGALTLSETLARIKNVDIIRSLENNLPEISANSNQLQQVIINLCNNAIDAMPEGGEIRISAKKSGAYVEIEVTDTGKGIPDKIKQHIFEPFFTTKEVGKGTGLGLSLVYEIVQKHNGTIEVESEPGKGTTFKIKLPIDR
ncbi:MAG: hypothetical protein A2252_05560 [Elusimicrobia bacterium RIFOXYA2_FULL_39_19]|nr:MAG: hypothetical protein A2252_05560 [Elusimicrobia bacterium RIFOXYA2_FULL_39_19]